MISWPANLPIGRAVLLASLTLLSATNEHDSIAHGGWQSGTDWASSS